MLYPSKQIRLKNGTAAWLRAPEIQDAQALIDLLKTVTEETDFLSSYPEEITMSHEDEERWIAGHRESPLTYDILCEIEGEIVGSCNLTRRKPQKMRHRATVGITIKQKYWNLGIGSAMFTEMLRAAKSRGTEIVELSVIEGNERAMSLYEKFGFKAVAVWPKEFKLKDGTYQNEIIMHRYL